ncbi:DUF1934 domain-containing protein [Ruminococcaceae bacterium OttesenSCG-928-I18]|nr:DUF1934 domain-containing protein [Ruminococcaceae bacterium OttesenSCG-928-I18]
MQDRYLIQIEGQMDLSGDVDTVNLMTRGSFIHKDGSFYITYEESEATGYAGNVTTVQVEDNDKVSMLRYGSMPSQLIIERGRRHVCHYDSNAGVISLGVAADEIISHLTERGGDVTFSYSLDSGSSHISHNKVKITVQEAN